MKKINGHELIGLLEAFSPKEYAMEGDRIGLQIGRLNRPAERVLIALDLVEEVVDEAIEINAQLIIVHHPPIYRPLAKVATDTVQGKIIEKLIKHDISVYVAHTNLDVAKGGVNDMLADALGLQNPEVLVPTFDEKLKKLAVFVPVDHADAVRKAIGSAGAGAIGEYSFCSFSSEGTGRFLPGEGTNPFIGQQGQIEEVEEVKVETIIPDRLVKKVISAMLKAHPYEEPAYDLYPLENKGESLGLGRIGTIEEMTLAEFANKVKADLDVENVRVVGNLDAKVKKVAVLGGDGNKYFSQAKFRGADVYVTGDIYYHVAHDGLMLGLNMIDPGHNVEKIMKKGLAAVLSQMCEKAGFDAEIIASEISTDPFKVV
ncbi:Nif3-like dinuclear metal center hexameric protein [Neobacillus notoginsengisoli]|uniref:GTP cyclohydrolase 1 type 2 homolog n=1 Tax=Neobacillus notoginsengisoli TaxID=1578198 RepID=A0A417YUQ3_9BACI|nr:Nif3-like dinuclear metal center hexameric protein [Neobacillus notoginsengisoli]RHW41034.1 Nif3-like dinuclear metal center hexameric protein [Neobacillus notoginsengisoli]